MAHFKPRKHDSEHKLQKILSYFVRFSEPKPSRGKVWHVLNSNQFGKSGGVSRKIFSENKDELLKRKLICEIEPIRERGTFYSITPLGICSIWYPIPKHLEKVLRILETFATKYTGSYKSYVFGNERIDFKNFVDNYLHYIDKEDPNYLGKNFSKILESTSIANDWIWISLPLLATGLLEISVARIFFNDNKISLAEFSAPYFANHVEINEFQFYQYLAKLLLCLLIYCDSQEDHTWGINYIEYMKSKGKKPEKFDLLPDLLKNENFKKITFMIHRVIQAMFDYYNKDNEYFSKTLNKIQFEVTI